MKKTQRKDAIRNIRRRIVSYLSVCLVVMLGLGGTFTTSYMGAGLARQAEDYYDAHNFKDFDLASSYGISESNLEKIRNADQVSDAEGVIQTDGSASFRGKKSNVTILSLTEKVSVPDIAEGKLPSGKNECAIGEDYAEVEGIRIGDKIRISATGLSNLSDQMSDDIDMGIEDGDTAESGTGQAADEESASEEKKDDLLYEKEFTVTGLMHHPDFLRRKAVNTVSLPLSAFNPDVTEGLYTRAFVRTEQPENADMFKEDYFDGIADTREALEELALELEEDRTQEVRDKANEYIDEEWARAEAQLADAQAEIDSGEAELNAELARGRKELNDAQKKLDRETEKYEKLFKESDKTIAEKEKELAAGKKELEANKKKLAEAKKQVKNGKKTIAEKEKELAEGKEQIAEGKALIKKVREKLGSDEDIDEMYEIASEIKKMTEEIDLMAEEGASPEEKGEKIKALGQYLLDKKDVINKMFTLAADPELSGITDDLKKYTDADLTEITEDTGDGNEYDYEQFLEDATAMAETGDAEVYNSLRDNLIKIADGAITLIDKYRDAEKQLKKAEKEAADGEAKIAAAKKEIKGYEAEIKKGEKTIARYEKEIEEGEKLLKQKKEELKDGKAEFAAEKAKGEKKIAAGWRDYYAQKARYEDRLREATSLLAENREKAEEKLEEARAEADSIEPCEWIVIDRKGNAGYVDIKSILDAIAGMGVLFGILFSIITAIVCFSTLVIIIDEQKPLVGTSKAFGFYKREILSKYLLFGISAAALGIILAVIGAYFLSEFVQVRYAASGLYPIGVAKSIITPGPIALFTLIILAVTVAATVIACSDILRSPASMLMKGAVLKKEKKHKKKMKTGSRGGSLYSRLIIRNMIEDKARVTVTVAIIAFSCMLMGLGISMKFAYDGMMSRQISDVNRFDIRMDMNDDVTDEDEKELVRVLEQSKVNYLPALSEDTMYRWNNRLDGVTVICADPAKIGEFYGIIDPETGDDITLPESGILIQKRMHESYGMNAGDSLPVLDSSLREHDMQIDGTFVNYAGRTVVLSPQAYRASFGEDSRNNCYFIKLEGADIDKTEEALLAVTDNISFVTKDEFVAKYESGSRLYNLLVLITTGIAVLISFMILTNLANIYLTRKKTELTIMRVNGFSIRETKGYLLKESLLTTAAGLILGVAAGAVLTPLAIGYIQQPDLEFIKSFHTAAWAAAVTLEALFSVVINAIVYNKVRDLNLRDIA